MELSYEEFYYYEHKEHLKNTILNVMKGIGLSVFDNRNGVSLYNYGTLQDVEHLFKDMGFAHVVSFMDYQAEYGYDEFEDVHDNKECVEVIFKSAIFDLEDN